MPSDLYKTGRLINNPDFVTRVSAAMVQYANVNLGTLTGNNKNLAIQTLLNPMVPEMSMIALTASDAAVLAAVTLDNGSLANVENLPDSAVKNVVSAKWGLVAAKFPNDPTPVAV